MKYIIFLFLVGFILMPSLNYAQLKNLRIDPSKAFGGTVSEYFESIEYIPLETTNESMFGDALKLIITDSSYVVFDADKNSLFFFALNGRFINKHKYPQDKWPGIQYISVKKHIQTLYSVNDKQVFIERFTLTGTKISEEKLQSSPDRTFLTGCYSLKFRDCFVDDTQRKGDSIVYIVDIFKDGKPVKAMLPYNKYDNLFQCRLYPWPINKAGLEGDSVVYASGMLTHYIYRITPDTVKPVYHFIFPANRTFSNSLIQSSNLKIIDSVRKIYRRASPDIIISVNNFVASGNKLFFKINPVNYIWNESTVANAQYNFFYHLESGKLVSYERLMSDDKSYSLPISDGPRTSINGLVTEKGVCYLPISSYRMFSAFEKNKEKNIQYTPVMQAYFKTQSRKSNPVILRMKLKE